MKCKQSDRSASCGRDSKFGEKVREKTHQTEAQLWGGGILMREKCRLRSDDSFDTKGGSVAPPQHEKKHKVWERPKRRPSLSTVPCPNRLFVLSTFFLLRLLVFWNGFAFLSSSFCPSSWRLSSISPNLTLDCYLLSGDSKWRNPNKAINIFLTHKKAK